MCINRGKIIWPAFCWRSRPKVFPSGQNDGMIMNTLRLLRLHSGNYYTIKHYLSFFISLTKLMHDSPCYLVGLQEIFVVFNGWNIYTQEQWKHNTKIYVNISWIYWIYFHRGFLVVSWIQKTDTILTLLVFMWTVQRFIHMRRFQP